MAQSNGKAPRPALPRKNADLGEDLGELPEDEVDDDSAGAILVPVINVSGTNVKFKVGTRWYKMRPGQIEKLEAAYGAPRVVRPGADPLPAVCELETNRKVLQVNDPRVDKDADGVPIKHREFIAWEAKQREAKSAQKQGGGQPRT